MNADYSWIRNVFLVLMVMLSVTGCIHKQAHQAAPDPVQAEIHSKTAAPTGAYPVMKNNFGDGYAAHISTKEAGSASQEEIVEMLVSQWLEHYQTQSKAESTVIEAYTVDAVILLERTEANDPEIVAGVRFSIIPAQIPNDWASFPGEEIHPDDTWWRLGAPVGVYREAGNFWLKLMFGRGT